MPKIGKMGIYLERFSIVFHVLATLKLTHTDASIDLMIVYYGGNILYHRAYYAIITCHNKRWCGLLVS